MYKIINRPDHLPLRGGKLFYTISHSSPKLRLTAMGAGGQKKLRLTDSGKNMVVENSYFIQFLLI